MTESLSKGSPVEGGTSEPRRTGLRGRLFSTARPEDELPATAGTGQPKGDVFSIDFAEGTEQLSDSLCRKLGIANAKEGLKALEEVLDDVSYATLKDALKHCAKHADVFMLTLQTRNGQQWQVFSSVVLNMQDQVGEVHLWFHEMLTAPVTPVSPEERYDEETGRLRQTKIIFESAFTHAPLPMWVRDSNLSIRQCNQAYSEIVEASPERVIAGEGLELDPAVLQVARQAAESGEMRSSEVHIITGGERRLFQVFEVPVIGLGQQFGYAVDISALEKVKAEIKLHLSAQTDLLETSASAMAVFGADQRLKAFNMAFVALWKLEEGWLETNPTYGEILEALREHRRLPEQVNFAAFKKAQLKMFTDLIKPQEEFYYLPDGTALRVIVIPHSVGGLLFAYEDVTDRLTLERSYNTLIAVQRATLDNLYEGVAVFGEDGRLRLFNPIYCNLWGLDEDFLRAEPHISELIEKTRGYYVFSEAWDQFREKVIASVTSRDPKPRRFERTDGKVLEFRCTPLPDGATLATYLDVTDSTLVERSLRERARALEEADQLKSEFLANVSYELRSPLTSIMGFSEILLNQYFGNLSERQKEYIEGINTSSSNLMDLINDILDVASIEAGFLKLERSTVDVSVLLNSVMALAQERAKEHHLNLVLDCPSDIGAISADETRLKQVAFNLLNNSIKFTPAGGHIVLGARKEAEGLRVWVEDTGVGIPLEEQEEVFDKFYKAGSSRPHKSGTGLGLTLVKNFVELHEGRVVLRSAPGEGTRVDCVLPLTTG